ncbi:L-ribulose-5-phosphate 3-epimerase UlaE [Sporomusa ovata DSM 2662]|uniref:Putaive isomerase n=1 Tax=Sporomusa ovata TaxID=2378 RepID=A0A0U1L2P4_9FIRM|nr:TIM barrel protein [Sporomusa ovata]EQB25222.1 sugar phosphate isomerase/epimerase [Sporomusa ovata DSM 2662]CQR73785.1 Putaive isomerase [Sporomusa ovata]
MELAFSTNGYVKFSLAESIKSIAALGYRGVEILADSPHINPLTISERECDDIVNMLASCKLKVSNINANTAICLYGKNRLPEEILFGPSLASSDSQLRAQRVEYTLKAIDLAAKLGAHCVSITSGRLTPGNPPDNAFRHLIASLSRVLEHALKRNVLIGIEYEPGLLVESEEDFLQLVQTINCPNLGLNLDIGHSHVAGENVCEVIARNSGRIWNVHIEDILGRRHYHLIPGEGDIDFTRVLSALYYCNYRSYLTVELYTYQDDSAEAARQSLAYLQDTLTKLGAKTII